MYQQSGAMVNGLNPVRYLDSFFEKYEDPRVASWPLMSSISYTLCLCSFYVYFVKILGPKLMSNKKALKLKNVLVVYNAMQVLFSFYQFYELGMSGWFTGDYSLKCQPVDYSYKPSAMRMANIAWWYYIAKFTEFFDTFFFVLRKKYDQITTLHVIHHGIMPISVWCGVKLIPGGHGSFFGLINTFIHVVMYTYYMLSAFGPSVQKYLWWKKYLTTLQMVQFVAIIVHSFQLLFIDCNFPRSFVWAIGLHGVLFFFLFKNFYKQRYTKTMGNKGAAKEVAKQC